MLGVLSRNGRLLLCHRRADRLWYPDVWDFPGGHIEAGETPASALGRELVEELGVRVTELGPVLDRWLVHDATGVLTEDMTILSVARWQGTVSNRAPEEHDDLGWFGLEDALRLRLPDPGYGPLLSGLPIWG